MEWEQKLNLLGFDERSLNRFDSNSYHFTNTLSACESDLCHCDVAELCKIERINIILYARKYCIRKTGFDCFKNFYARNFIPVSESNDGF